MNKADSNHLNAQSSTGSRNTTSTRLNAVKHSLLAKGITELDDPEAYESLAQMLAQEYRPVGDLEKFFVKRRSIKGVKKKNTSAVAGVFLASSPPH
ncbi:MAG: hypothetical protein WA886_10825 [Candidatus Acidiferrales bacterium]